MTSQEITVRTLSTPDEVAAWLPAVAAGFLRAETMSDEEVAALRGTVDPARAQGAYVVTADGAECCVATCRSFPQELTVPGGGTVAASAVTGVTVQPTHRRRGLLRRMMGNALDAAKERGDLCSTLISAEYPIYGRFGYGPATYSAEYEVDLTVSGLDRGRAADTGDGRIELVNGETVREAGPALYERVRFRPENAGHVSRAPEFWQMHTGVMPRPGSPTPSLFHALYRDSAGTAQGLASYTVKSDWETAAPRGVVQVMYLHSATAAAENALWDYLLRIDWTQTLSAPRRALDDVLPALLPNPRAARVATHADFLWLRPLDVPGLLTSRSYPTAGSLVLEVRDDDGYAGGRFRLDADEQGSTCRPSGEPAELTLPVSALGALYLGEAGASRLLRLGRVDEHRAGAAQRADVLLRTARRPWCPDRF